MLISHAHRFLFVHIYKNAGSAISASLEPWASHSVHDLPYHWTAAEIRAHLGHSEFPTLNAAGDWRTYWTFAVIRNPFDWAVSLYHWLAQNEVHDLAPFVRGLGRFAAFVSWLHDPEAEQPPAQDGSHALYRRPQAEFVCDDTGQVIVKEILRFETINTSFPNFCRRLWLPATLVKSNESQHGPYRQYYDRATRERIQDLYSRDFDLFGYQF